MLEHSSTYQIVLALCKTPLVLRSKHEMSDSYSDCRQKKLILGQKVKKKNNKIKPIFLSLN